MRRGGNAGSAAAEPARPARIGGSERVLTIDRGALALTAVLLVVAGALALSSLSVPPVADEAIWELAALSLAKDGDLLFTFEDEERLRAWPSRAAVAPELLFENDRLRFALPRAYPLLLAPFVTLVPRVGPLIVNLALLICLLGLAYSSLERLREESPGWMLTAAVFGTALGLYVRTLLPALFLATVTAGALAAFAFDTPVVSRRLRNMYPREPGLGGAVVRWLIGGALLGILALHHPVYLLLAVVPVALVQRSRLVAATAVAAFVVAAILSVAWTGGGLWSHVGEPPAGADRVRVSVAESPTSVERAALDAGSAEPWRLYLESPRLAMWNGLYAVAGRHLGVLPYFPMTLWLLAGWGRPGRRALLVVAAVLALSASVVWAPFDFGGLPASLGAGLFVPFFVALWWLPAKPPGRASALIALAVGLAILWPFWRPAVAPLEAIERGRLPGGPVLARLPYETTQKNLPVQGEIVTRDLLVRAVSGLEPGGRVSQLRLTSEGRAELLIAASKLGRVELHFGGAVGTELEAPGWTVAETMLTPSGGVVFTIRPDGPVRRHPVWWDDAEQEVRLLRFSLAAPAGTTLSVSSQPLDSGE